MSQHIYRYGDQRRRVKTPEAAQYRSYSITTLALLPQGDWSICSPSAFHHWSLWMVFGEGPQGAPFYRKSSQQHLGDWWEGYALIINTVSRDWATEIRTPRVPNPYRTYTNPILHLCQPYTALILNLHCICSTSTLHLCQAYTASHLYCMLVYINCH